MGANYYTNNVPHEDFVKAWTKVHREGGQIAEVSEMLGMRTKNVYHRADRLRRMGVKLPNFRDRELITEDRIDKLNKLVQETGNE